VRFGRAPSFATAVARDYMAVMQATPYGHILFGLQILCGLLVIADLFVLLALTILAAYIFNIYMFHIFFERGQLALVVVLTALWICVFLRYRDAFRPLLLPRTPAL
jgi:putative oxidoreductase